MAQVVLKNLAKTYPGAQHPAVHDVDLTIADGEFLVLVGPSGCGKSTTLRMIAGLEMADGGDILIGERRVNDVSPRDRDVAMVFQNYALYPHMTVYGNLAFGLRMRKFPKAEVDRRVRACAATLGLEEMLDRKPRALSGGQRQRVALGRAIVRQPQVFLLDEPLSNLDARMRGEMRAELKKLHRRLGTTMIYVTHDQVEAMTLGERIVVMHEGRVQQVDAPLSVYEQPANRFVAGFIGSPPMNFIPGRIATSPEALLFEAEGLRLAVEWSQREKLEPFVGREVVLGLRPEMLQAAGEWDEPVIEPLVEVVEPMGSETILMTRLGSLPLTARVAARTPARPGEPLRLMVVMSRAHFFDPATGKTIA